MAHHQPTDLYSITTTPTTTTPPTPSTSSSTNMDPCIDTCKPPPVAAAAPADYVTGICCTIVILQSIYFICNYPFRIPIQHRIALLIFALFILGEAAVRLTSAVVGSGSGNLSYIKLVPAISSFLLAIMLLWLIPTTLQFLRYIAQLELENTLKVEELLSANRSAQKAIKEKHEFLGSISHELRNPLHVIVQTVDLLLGTELDPMQRERATTIQENGTMMVTLLDDTITVTRMESGRMVLERIAVDLKRLTRTQVHDLELRADKKGVRFDLRYGGNVPRYVVSDPTRIKQLLFNLLTNAIKFTKDNSCVTVEVSVVDILSADDLPTRLVGEDHDHPHPHPHVMWIGPSALPPAPTFDERRTSSQDLAHPVYYSLSKLAQFSDKARSIYLDYTDQAVHSTSTGADVHEPAVEFEDEHDALPEQMLKISVIDQGVGISDTSLSLLFQAFTQARSSTTRLYGGSGLGLSICALIVRAMHGAIQVTSEINRGSEFSFLLPLLVLNDEQFERASDIRVITASADSAVTSTRFESNSPGTLVVEPSPVARPLSEWPVLVVDDSRINCKLMTQVLETMGYSNVSTANDGLEALTAFELRAREHPDDPFLCCFMDLQMPHMDGLEAARQLRARGYTTPLIALTGNATSESRGECLAAGMNHHLTKPFRRQMVQELLTWAREERERGKGRSTFDKAQID